MHFSSLTIGRNAPLLNKMDRKFKLGEFPRLWFYLPPDRRDKSRQNIYHTICEIRTDTVVLSLFILKAVLSAIREMVRKKESFKTNDAVGDRLNGVNDDDEGNKVLNGFCLLFVFTLEFHPIA